ncbi:MAG: WD40 repeat domain-containing protein [Streptosporangiaceae bacterium]
MLANILGVSAPRWSGKVLAGPPGPSCAGRVNFFCPVGMTATPDGKFVALADFNGRLKVFSTATGKVLLDKTLPAPAELNETRKLLTASVGVWISPDGRLASRDLTVISSSGAESTIGFGIWDVATGQALVGNGPTSTSPWAPILNVAFGPGHSVIITFDQGVPRSLWLTASVEGGAIRFLEKYESQVQPDKVVYSGRQSAWVAVWRDGYALWSAATRVRYVSRPECVHAISEAIDDEGQQFACDADGDPIKGSRVVKVWNISTGVLSSQVSTGTYGVVSDITFLDGGRSIALTTQANSYDSTKQSLLVLSMGPHPVLRSVTSLPDISGGWGPLALGRFAVALGNSANGRVCCVAVVAAP